MRFSSHQLFMGESSALPSSPLGRESSLPCQHAVHRHQEPASLCLSHCSLTMRSVVHLIHHAWIGSCSLTAHGLSGFSAPTSGARSTSSRSQIVSKRRCPQFSVSCMVTTARSNRVWMAKKLHRMNEKLHESHTFIVRLSEYEGAGLDVASDFIKGEKGLDDVNWKREKKYNPLVQQLVELYGEIWWHWVRARTQMACNILVRMFTYSATCSTSTTTLRRVYQRLSLEKKTGML